MKAWVFNEDQLEKGINDWLAARSPSLDDQQLQIKLLINDFLYSEAARKLRIGQLQTKSAPEA